MTCASGIDEAELDDVPLAAQLGKHDVHGPADLRQIARLFGDLDWSAVMSASRSLARPAREIGEILGYPRAQPVLRASVRAMWASCFLAGEARSWAETTPKRPVSESEATTRWLRQTST